MKDNTLIITLRGYHNYGNLLQNYAVQQVLKQYFRSVTTYNYLNKEVKKQSKFKKMIKAPISFVKNPIDFYKKLKYYINLKQYNKLIIEREKQFKDFFVSKIKYIDTFDYNNNIFDYYVVGSDQVWNYEYGANPLFFLNPFDELKRVSYAASFGADFIPNHLIDYYVKHLNGIPQISVREQSGAKIIKDLTGKDSPVLIDPTMMITKDDWQQVAKVCKNKPNVKYLFAYFLGEKVNKFRKESYQYANKTNLKTVEFNNKHSMYYTNGPAEFIDYIKDAQIVFTNSFHGAVFSIIFKKPFVLFSRDGMNSRIETLLTTFKLKDRMWDKVKQNQSYLTCDYSQIDDILNEERNKAYKFLSKAFGIY